jgi:hypothetical protein
LGKLLLLRDSQTGKVLQDNVDGHSLQIN